MGIFFCAAGGEKGWCIQSRQTEGFSITQQQYYAVGCFSSYGSTTVCQNIVLTCSFCIQLVFFYHPHTICLQSPFIAQQLLMFFFLLLTYVVIARSTTSRQYLFVLQMKSGHTESFNLISSCILVLMVFLNGSDIFHLQKQMYFNSVS